MASNACLYREFVLQAAEERCLAGHCGNPLCSRGLEQVGGLRTLFWSSEYLPTSEAFCRLAAGLQISSAWNKTCLLWKLSQSSCCAQLSVRNVSAAPGRQAGHGRGSHAEVQRAAQAHSWETREVRTGTPTGDNVFCRRRQTAHHARRRPSKLPMSEKMNVRCLQHANPTLNSRPKAKGRESAGRQSLRERSD